MKKRYTEVQIIKAIKQHEANQGSAEAQTITNIVTAEGLPLSRYRAGHIMKKLG